MPAALFSGGALHDLTGVSLQLGTGRKPAKTLKIMIAGNVETVLNFVPPAPRTGNVAGLVFSSTTLTRAILFTGIVLPAGKSIRAVGGADYSVLGTSAGFQGLVGKFRYAPTGTSSWTDMGVAVAGSNSIRTGGFEPETTPGSLGIDRTATPSPASYDIELLLGTSSGTRGVIVDNGPVSISFV